MNSGQRTFAVSLLKKLNIPANSQNVRALVGWERAEGGHWNNNARYNPLNTTQPEPGAGNTGTQGNIKVYRNWDQGLNATVETLRNGRYGNILQALRSGNAGQVAQAIGSSPWGTSASLIQRVIGGTPGQPVSAGALGGQKPAKPKQQVGAGGAGRAAKLAAFSAYAANPHLPGASTELALSLLSAQRQAQQPAPNAPKPRTPPSSGPAAGAKKGDPVLHGTGVGGAHQTAGLPGYPARDYFAPAGSAAVAPVTGRVFKLSGHDPKLGPVEGAGGPLGWSVYIHGTDGRDYYLTHMGSRNVRVGETVRQGQKIGTVANYHSYGRPDHIHLGIKG